MSTEGMKFAPNYTVAEPGLEVGAGRVSSLAAYGRFASKEPSTERAGCGAGRRLLRIT